MSVLENLFTDIADAIRDKTGETDAIRPIDFPEKIAGIKENSIELLENVLIQPNFSNGDQSFSAPDEMAVKSAIIQKPETLIPENIAEGVDIAGIIGTLASSGGGDGVSVGDALYAANTYGIKYGLSGSGTKTYKTTVELPANAKILRVFYGDGILRGSTDGIPKITNIAETTAYEKSHFQDNSGNITATVSVTKTATKTSSSLLIINAMLFVLYTLEEMA